MSIANCGLANCTNANASHKWAMIISSSLSLSGDQFLIIFEHYEFRAFPPSKSFPKARLPTSAASKQIRDGHSFIEPLQASLREFRRCIAKNGVHKPLFLDRRGNRKPWFRCDNKNFVPLSVQPYAATRYLIQHLDDRWRPTYILSSWQWLRYGHTLAILITKARCVLI